MNSPTGEDRRKNLTLRQIFPAACAKMADVLEQPGNKVEVSIFYLMHVLQGYYPDFTQTDLHIMANAIERLHQAGNLREVKS